MSINYYCKVVSKDKKEIVASIDVWCSVRDYMQSRIDEFMLCDIKEDEMKALPSYVISKNEKTNRSFLGKADAYEFISNHVKEFESKIAESKTKLENLKLKLLLAKTDTAYGKIEEEISWLEEDISYNEELKNGFTALQHDVEYELNERRFFKNNKEIWRDKEYKYRAIEDYDLYFFWT